ILTKTLSQKSNLGPPNCSNMPATMWLLRASSHGQGRKAMATMYQPPTISVVPCSGRLKKKRPITSTPTCSIIRKPAISPTHSRPLIGPSTHRSNALIAAIVSPVVHGGVGKWGVGNGVAGSERLYPHFLLPVRHSHGVRPAGSDPCPLQLLQVDLGEDLAR